MNQGEVENPQVKVYDNVVVYKTIQINMIEVLQQLPKIYIEPYIQKYPLIISESPNEVQEDSTLKIFCEERDQEGQLLNKDKLVQLVRYSMKSKKMEHLHVPLLTMKEGDEAWYEVTGNQTNYYKIKVVSVQKPSLPTKLTTIESRLQQFENFRNDGKILFNRNQFKAAIKKYQKGINFMEAWPKEFDSDKRVKEQKKFFYLLFCSNIAQCEMDLKEYSKAIMILEDIIPQCRMSEFEIKNYYRIIACYVKCGEIDKAQFYLSEVKHICNLSTDQIKVFEWLEEECKPQKKVKL